MLSAVQQQTNYNYDFDEALSLNIAAQGFSKSIMTCVLLKVHKSYIIHDQIQNLRLISGQHTEEISLMKTTYHSPALSSQKYIQRTSLIEDIYLDCCPLLRLLPSYSSLLTNPSPKTNKPQAHTPSSQKQKKKIDVLCDGECTQEHIRFLLSLSYALDAEHC